MSVPARQGARMGWYLARQKLARREKFPLIVELEPLFQCNLACPGCGKIQQPEPLLRQRMGAPDGSDPRRRAADSSRDPHDRAGADRAQALRLSLHQRAAVGEEDGE